MYEQHCRVAAGLSEKQCQRNFLFLSFKSNSMKLSFAKESIEAIIVKPKRYNPD